MNMVTQPVYDRNEIPFTEFSLVRRHGLCEQLGESGRCRVLKQMTTHQASTLRTQRCATSLSSHHGAGLQRCARSRFWWVSYIFSEY